MKPKRSENILFAVISLLVGFYIVSHYTSALPDFDIALNEAGTFLFCGTWTFVLWGVLLFLFCIIGKQVDDFRKRRLFKIVAVLAYWVIVWGICYYQCAIKAVRDWNEMMNGNAG